MAKIKIKTLFFCQSCGYESPKWLGKCPACESWNLFVEEKVSSASKMREDTNFLSLKSENPVSLEEISLENLPRYHANIQELNRVLGGGIVPGTLILLGGDPGIGKSTLVLQLLDQLATNNISVLYVTGEESKEQIKLRADRLNISSKILILTENDLERIFNHVEKIKPQVLVIDSIQTVFLPHLEASPGSVSQVRECAGKLLYLSKSTLTSTILIGHVTKEGIIAGPRILEHMVDTVLYFEGENTGQFRLLRTIKNRYGSTNEIGVFEMTAQGLKEISNPSQLFLRERSSEASGTCLTASFEGSRAILTEVQALVSGSALTNPRRTSIGIEHNRMALIIAVIEKILGLKLFDQDIYVSAAGGLKLQEPACDLAILLSLVSSFKNRPISPHLVALGEIGLSGEIRSISHLEKRLQEAIKMGYRTVLIPSSNKMKLNPKNSELISVAHVSEVLDKVF